MNQERDYRIAAANAMALSALARDREVAGAYRELAQAYLAISRLSERTVIRSLMEASAADWHSKVRHISPTAERTAT
jgi:hypothetical protein